METPVKAIEWKDNKLVLIDQRVLPQKESYLEYDSLEGTHEAIKVMVTRGAPLIGFTALYGMVLWLQQNPGGSASEFAKAGEYLITARPTAVNLAYEVNRSIQMAKAYESEKGNLNGFRDELLEFSHKQIELIYEKNMAMAKHAEKELTEIYGPDKKLRLMTLCNTGFLACGPMGTALGVITYLNSVGRVEHVYASETRPYLQGGRLTSYELMKAGIPHEINVEGAFSYMLRNKLVDAVFIGADRIVANGDTANKIGSSTLAIVCKHYGIPFYTVAPLSSFDFSLASGDDIEIEMRPEDEVLGCQGVRIAPETSRALNPSFDVTDHTTLTGVICEKGIVKNPTTEKMKVLLG